MPSWVDPVVLKATFTNTGFYLAEAFRNHPWPHGDGGGGGGGGGGCQARKPAFWEVHGSLTLGDIAGKTYPEKWAPWDPSDEQQQGIFFYPALLKELAENSKEATKVRHYEN